MTSEAERMREWAEELLRAHKYMGAWRAELLDGIAAALAEAKLEGQREERKRLMAAYRPWMIHLGAQESKINELEAELKAAAGR
ncbi:MAG: hypothetical protein WBA09_22170 [Candidatus Acidiferrum sp.]